MRQSNVWSFCYFVCFNGSCIILLPAHFREQKKPQHIIEHNYKTTESACILSCFEKTSILLAILKKKTSTLLAIFHVINEKKNPLPTYLFIRVCSLFYIASLDALLVIIKQSNNPKLLQNLLDFDTIPKYHKGFKDWLAAPQLLVLLPV